MKKKNKYSLQRESKICLIIAGLVGFVCFLPLWIAFCASITEESELIKNGYSIFLPAKPTLNAYQYLLISQGKSILRALKVSVLSTGMGTLLSLFVMICYGYAAAQKRKVYRYSNTISFIAWFTTVFSGGILPWYILCTRYYGLVNNIWALIIPGLFSTFQMFILRNGFRAIPQELFEAARIDGASPAQCMTRIALPLAKVSIVTVTMFTALRYWNDFTLSLYLGTKREYFTLQKLLYNMLTNLREMFNNPDIPLMAQMSAAPNTARMALTLLTVLPVIIVYPFAQKYLVQGVTVGGVKG